MLKSSATVTLNDFVAGLVFSRQMHTLSSRVLLLDNRLRVVEGHIVAQHKQQQQQQQQKPLS